MEKKRFIKLLSVEQAAELLGSDTGHQRRVRSAEGMRFAFRGLPVPGFRGVCSVEEVTAEDISVGPQIADLDN